MPETIYFEADNDGASNDSIEIDGNNVSVNYDHSPCGEGICMLPDRTGSFCLKIGDQDTVINLNRDLNGDGEIDYLKLGDNEEYELVFGDQIINSIDTSILCPPLPEAEFFNS